MITLEYLRSVNAVAIINDDWDVEIRFEIGKVKFWIIGTTGYKINHLGERTIVPNVITPEVVDEALRLL